MHIYLFNQQQTLSIEPEAVRSIAKEVLLAENQSCDEVSIYFIETEEMCALHDEFFQDPSPTDCISFPMDYADDEIGYQILGEIFVCPATALEYASKHGKDPYEETTLYIIHGLLHLIGYDDIEEEDRKCMRQAEKRLMQRLKRKHFILRESL